MDKKKTTIYLYILITVFTIFIGASTYAFFAGNNNFSATANLTAAAGDSYTFTSTSATDFNLDINSADMSQSKSGNYISSSLGSIDVDLNSPDGMITACTFDLLLTWTSAQKYTESDVSLPYTHTDGVTYNYEFSTIITDKDTDNIEFPERDISKVNRNTGFVGTSSGTIAEDLIIKADSTSVSKTYNIEARIYNLPVNQQKLINKNMNASISVSNINCDYVDEEIDISTLNYLSTNSGNTIFNLVNKQGVDVTNVNSIYFVNTSLIKPNRTESVALFKGTDNNVIKAWTNGNNLYLGSKGTTYPGPSLAYAFNNTRNLNVLDMNNANTSNVTRMDFMFRNTGYSSTNFTLNLGSEFNTSKVTNMSYMFSNTGQNSTNFTLNLGNDFNTSKVTDMSYMFSNTGYNSTNFTLNLGNDFNTSNVTSMSSMFSDTGRNSAVFTLNLGNEFNTSKVTDMSRMFSSTGRNSPNFTLDLGNQFNTSNVRSMIAMFSYTGNYSQNFTLNLGKQFNTINVSDMGGMFSGTGQNSSIFILNLGEQFYTSNVKVMSSMFYYTGRYNPNFTLNLGNHFNTSKVTRMDDMFSSVGEYSNNFELNLGNQFNTSNVTDMSGMFDTTGRGSINFTLNLGNHFNTSKVTTMSSMFSGTGEYSNNFVLNLGSQFNTSNVTTMYHMFSGTGRSSKIFNLDLGNAFDTSKVTTMYYMFFQTAEYTNYFTLNLGNKFNTSNVIDMSGMFFDTGANSTWTLNLKSFDFSKVTNYEEFLRPGFGSSDITILCSPTNGDFINARVNEVWGYNVICS